MWSPPLFQPLKHCTREHFGLQTAAKWCRVVRTVSIGKLKISTNWVCGKRPHISLNWKTLCQIDHIPDSQSSVFVVVFTTLTQPRCPKYCCNIKLLIYRIYFSIACRYQLIMFLLLPTMSAATRPPRRPEVRYADQWTAAYMIASSVAFCGSISSTILPCLATRMRSETASTSGR